MKKPIVVNFFGAPGSGKSTCAAYVFSVLKANGVNCELITEYAKDKTWEGNFAALNNQAYVFGKQYYRMSRCQDQVDVIITDSPLPLSIIYNKNPALGKSFKKMIIEVFNSYNNINYMLYRTASYSSDGRKETEEESNNISKQIEKLLSDNKINITSFEAGKNAYTTIAKDVLNKIFDIKDE